LPLYRDDVPEKLTNIDVAYNQPYDLNRQEKFTAFLLATCGENFQNRNSKSLLQKSVTANLRFDAQALAVFRPTL
jgi:hypothetical protein